MNFSKEKFLCKICHLVIDKPTRLPCSNTVCKSHFYINNRISNPIFKCPLCQTNHDMHSGRFYPNFFMQNQLNANIHLTYSEVTLKKDLQCLIQKAAALNEKFKVDFLVDSHFQNVENEINMQTEKVGLVRKDTILTRTAQLKDNFKEAFKKLTKKSNTLLTKVNIEDEFRKNIIQFDNLEKFKNELDENINRLEEDLDIFLGDLRSCMFVPYNKVDLSNTNSLGYIYTPYKLITGYFDSTIRIKDQYNLNSSRFFGKHSCAVKNFIISLDNKYLISIGQQDTFVKIWNLSDGKFIKNLHPNIGFTSKHNFLINSAIVNEFMCVYSFCGGSRIINFNIKTEKSILILDFCHQLISCCKVFNKNILLIGYNNSTIRVWNTETKNGEVLRGHSEKIKCLESIDEFRFASASTDATIRIWEKSNQNNLFTNIKTIFADNSVRKLKIVKHLNIILALTRCIIVLSLTDDFKFIGELISNNKSHPKYFETLPNDQILVGNANKTLEIWCLKSLKSLKILKDYPSEIQAMNIYFPYE
jgi:WD40 repeat protein